MSAATSATAAARAAALAGSGLALPAGCAALRRCAVAPAIANALQALWRLARRCLRRAGLGTTARALPDGRALGRTANAAWTTRTTRSAGAARATRAARTTRSAGTASATGTASTTRSAGAINATGTTRSAGAARAARSARTTKSAGTANATGAARTTRSLGTANATRTARSAGTASATGAADPLAALRLVHPTAHLVARLVAARTVDAGAVRPHIVAHPVVGIGDAAAMGGVVRPGVAGEIAAAIDVDVVVATGIHVDVAAVPIGTAPAP